MQEYHHSHQAIKSEYIKDIMLDGAIALSAITSIQLLLGGEENHIKNFHTFHLSLTPGLLARLALLDKLLVLS